VSKPAEEIKGYYDAHLRGKLEGFVEGNRRIERAWTTVTRWAPLEPAAVLEIGCGIGDICWRMARRWKAARVVGLDISPASVAAARKLFGSAQLTFHEGPLTPGSLEGPFDLVLMMDVYEHIAAEDRAGLQKAIAGLLGPRGSIILSVPTPRHLEWLRLHDPAEIQPVDEDIRIETLSELARETGTEILLYEEVDVWHQGDYAHAVLGRRGGWTPVLNPDEDRGVRARLLHWTAVRREPRPWDRSKRLAWVRGRLGSDSYR
jgi:SAM-dependent methyltransferase